MANEDRFTAPRNPQTPDRADEVARRADVNPPVQPPPNQGTGTNFEDRPTAARDTAANRDGGIREGALFAPPEITRLRNQWTDIQATFVDEPKSAVKRADALVGDVLKSLSDTFARERSNLESQWTRDGNVTTEDFRMALRKYRE